MNDARGSLWRKWDFHILNPLLCSFFFQAASRMAFRVTFSKKSFITDESEETFTDTSGKILELIASNKNITIPEIAKNI